MGTHDFRISFQDLNSSNQTKPNQSTLPQKWSLLRMLPTTLVTRPASSPPALPRRPTRTSPRTATPTPARVPLQPRMLLVTSSREQELCFRRGQQAEGYALSVSALLSQSINRLSSPILRMYQYRTVDIEMMSSAMFFRRASRFL